jgi:6-phospho-beta-glucosidase
MRTSIARYFSRPLDAVFVDYVGLNHLGWIRDVTLDGISRQDELLQNFTALQAVGHEWSLFDPPLVQALGLLPNEYLYYFYYRDRAFENIRSSGSTRGIQIQAINQPLWATLSRAHQASDASMALDAYAAAMLSRSGSYMARESGHQATVATHGSGADAALALFEDEGYAGLAMDVMQAIVQDRKATLVLNVRNDGCLAELEDEDVIEAVSLVDAHGIRPLAQRRLPESIQGLVQSIKAYERQAVQAAVCGDRDAAVLALALHPLVGSWPMASSLVESYLSEHKDMLPQFH